MPFVTLAQILVAANLNALVLAHAVPAGRAVGCNVLVPFVDSLFCFCFRISRAADSGDAVRIIREPAVSGKILCILCIDVNQKSTRL